MRKNGFTIIEVVVVFLLMLGVLFLVLPKSLDSTKQARFISKWSEKFSELEYMFSVLKIQKNDKLQDKMIKPYLRITSEVKIPYRQKFMNGIEVTSQSKYYFDKFYFTSSNEVIGLKFVNPDCKDKDLCSIISIDVNGTNPPNKWGYDIFGINVFFDRIEPLGQDISFDDLKTDCSKYGSGLYCSYYYLIGGKFD